MTTDTYVSIQPYTMQMRSAANAKCQRVLVLALCLVIYYYLSRKGIFMMDIQYNTNLYIAQGRMRIEGAAWQ